LAEGACEPGAAGDRIQAGVAPGRTATAEGAGVSSVVVVGWLLAFTLLEWARSRFGAAGSPGGLAGTVSALECLELAALARLVRWRAPASRVGPLEAGATLVLVALVCLVADARPLLSAGLLSLYVLGRFARTAEHRPLAIALFVFTAQYLLQTGPFIWLHALVGRIDAAVVRTALQRLGYDVSGYSTFVVRWSQHFVIDVQEGCASSYVASVAICGFVVLVLGLRGSLRRADLAWAALLLAAIVLVNWLRLLPIALGRDGWLYWHEGAGAAIIATLDGAMVVALAWLAVRRTRRREAAA
jgi:hypothetical protein